MSSHKRTHQALKTPVAILQYLQSVLCDRDYQDVQECAFEHDQHLQKTQQECKKACSETFLYTKACAAMFAELHAVLMGHCEFVHTLHRLLDVSRLIEKTTMESIAQHDAMVVDHEGGGKNQADYEKTAVQRKTECFQRECAEIALRFQKTLREDKEKITNTNSQLRFSLQYKTFARVLHLARGNEESGTVSDNYIEGMNGKDRRTPDSLVDGIVKNSNAYAILKNQCMLGAVLKYTERSKKRLECERNKTRVGALGVHTTACIARLESELIKNAMAMFQTTHSQNDMRVKICSTLGKIKTENTLLQAELDSVHAKIKQLQK